MVTLRQATSLHAVCSALADSDVLSKQLEKTAVLGLCKLAVGDSTMTIELPKQIRASAIASIKRYFEENMPEPIGDMPAGLLLNFLIEEIGPLFYNRAIADAQERLQQRVSDLNGELYAEEFQYWPKLDKKRRSRV